MGLMGDNAQVDAQSTGGGNGASMMGGGIGAIVGAMSDEWNTNRNVSNNKKMMNWQAQRNEEMARRNQLRNKEMWDYTNYENQVKHMEGAGLNKALMYGGGGGGGATTSGGAGSGVGLGSAQATNSGTMMAMANMKEMALLQAQKENIEADTANKKADLPVKLADAGLKGSQKGNLDIDTEFKTNTLDDRQLQEQAKAVGGFIENTNKEKDTTLKQAQIDKMAQDIAQGWKGLDQKDQEIAIKKFEAELKAMYPSESQVIGGAMNEMVRKIKETLGLQDEHKKI